MKTTIKHSINLFLLILLTYSLSGCEFESKDNLASGSSDSSSTNSSQNIIIDSETIASGYLDFGSYPQTEIVSNVTDTGINGKDWSASDDYILNVEVFNKLNNLDENQWDSNGNTTLDGIKYRRLTASEATYSTNEDVNYYDWAPTDTYHYFKFEPIRWRILECKDNNLFLLSEFAIDDQKYHSEITNLTWETSTIRSWLNGYDASHNLYSTDYSNNNFLTTAFSTAEQSKINVTNVINADSVKHGTEGGNDTNDFVFLLSEDELYGTEAIKYGFDDDYDTKDEARRCKSTTYAKAMGVFADCEEDYLGNCDWWMRSPGSYTGLYDLVYTTGRVYRGGQHANSKTRGVRPAINIKIS